MENVTATLAYMAIHVNVEQLSMEPSQCARPGPMVCCAQAQRLESATAESACATRTLMGLKVICFMEMLANVTTLNADAGPTTSCAVVTELVVVEVCVSVIKLPLGTSTLERCASAILMMILAGHHLMRLPVVAMANATVDLVSVNLGISESSVSSVSAIGFVVARHAERLTIASHAFSPSTRKSWFRRATRTVLLSATT